jgi:hypothetical protein
MAGGHPQGYNPQRHRRAGGRHPGRGQTPSPARSLFPALRREHKAQQLLPAPEPSGLARAEARGNSHVRFLGGPGAAMRPAYPANSGAFVVWERACAGGWPRAADDGGVPRAGHPGRNELSGFSAAGPRLNFSSRSSRSAHVLLHSVSGLRICSSTASCSSKEDSWAFSASMLRRCAATLPEIAVSCAAERAPGSGNVPGASGRRAPNPARSMTGKSGEVRA